MMLMFTGVFAACSELTMHMEFDEFSYYYSQTVYIFVLLAAIVKLITCDHMQHMRRSVVRSLIM